jgi:hypothetical protein
MRQVTKQIAEAFLNGKAKVTKNTTTDGKSLYLFGNKIAEHREDGLYITNCGWPTKTTKERLNGLDGVNIHQAKNKWYLNGNEWDGDWIKVNSNPPPAVDEKKVGNLFDLTKRYVKTDAWRGYEEYVYAVCGANDTGMWDDSPCPSNVRAKEIGDAVSLLKSKGIPTKEVVAETSNVFCVHVYVVVPPKYHEKAREIVREHIDSTENRLIYAV